MACANEHVPINSAQSSAYSLLLTRCKPASIQLRTPAYRHESADDECGDNECVPRDTDHADNVAAVRAPSGFDYAGLLSFVALSDRVRGALREMPNKSAEATVGIEPTVGVLQLPANPAVIRARSRSSVSERIRRERRAADYRGRGRMSSWAVTLAV